MRFTCCTPMTIALAVLLAVMVSAVMSKSIIREMLEPRQFLPGAEGGEKDGKPVNRPGRQLEEIPIENCRVTQTRPDLSKKLDRLCDDCSQIYKVPNFYVQCRARCYDNAIVGGCAMALFRNELMTEWGAFMNSDDFKLHGMTMAPPTRKSLSAESLLQQLQKLDRA